jgi:hypothetical protein
MQLLFIGDIMLGSFGQSYRDDRTDCISLDNTLLLFRNADLRALNGECVNSDWRPPWPATPRTFNLGTGTKTMNV